MRERDDKDNDANKIENIMAQGYKDNVKTTMTEEARGVARSGTSMTSGGRVGN